MVRVKYKKKNLKEMSKSSPSTSLAHLVLCGSSAWALKYTSKFTPLAKATFSYLLGYSVVATLNYSNPNDNPNLKKACDIMGLLAEIAPLPLMASQLYLLQKENPTYAYIPVITIVIPLIPQLLDAENRDLTSDIACELMMAGNIVALMYRNYEYDSPWIWGLIALTTINQFVFRRLAEKYEVPKIDMIVLGLSFFCVFAVNSLCDTI